MTIISITQVVLAVGANASLRPYMPRHTYGARYFRAGTAEQAGVIETVFE
ncbi:hypothetical protein [Nocardia gipuzkoensis]|nr:hypothetical protein [Nocardia gipuzkoensis]